LVSTFILFLHLLVQECGFIDRRRDNVITLFTVAL
jgi:hypothetical protein